MDVTTSVSFAKKPTVLSIGSMYQTYSELFDSWAISSVTKSCDLNCYFITFTINCSMATSCSVTTSLPNFSDGFISFE